MKIYYAHSRMKYNTLIEQYELALIRQRFPEAEIINPNGLVNQNQDNETAMQECYKLIGECNILVFSSISGVIGKGVYREIKRAKKIFYINDNTVNQLMSCEFMVADEIPELKNMGIDPDMIYAVVL